MRRGGLTRLSPRGLVAVVLGIIFYAPTASHAAPAPCDQRSGDPFYLCLPERLEADFVERDRAFVPLPPAREAPPLVSPFPDATAHPPADWVNTIGSLRWDSENAEPLILSAFPQDEFVKLPRGTKIVMRAGLSDPEASGKADRYVRAETWDYPEGTEIVHRIFVQGEEGRRLLEVRMLRRLLSGRWAMGAYVPDPSDSLKLELRKETWTPTEVAVRLPAKDNPSSFFRARFFPLGAQSCRKCHWMEGTESGSIALSLPVAQRSEFVGPCGFGPAMESARLREWIRRYRRRFGESPLRH